MGSSDWLPEWLKGEKQIEDWDVDEMVRTLLIGSEVEWIIEAEKRGFDEKNGLEELGNYTETKSHLVDDV